MLRIKHERLLLGWNQTALSFRTGISIGDISRIETGRLRPYPSQVERLAAVLGVTSDELMQDVTTSDAAATSTVGAA